WGVNWKAPAKMVGLLAAGVGVAIWHHAYYNSLVGTSVATDESKWDRKSQQWQIRYGIAFAFASKTCLAASISIAYQQHIWTTMGRKPISVSGLDATFGAINDLSSFISLSFISNVKLGALLAALIWLMPLSALITPATLTVVTTTKVTPTTTNVPMVDYANTSTLFYTTEINAQTDMNTVDNGVSPFLNRLLAATASSLDILPMAAISPSAEYSLEFSAPSLRCAMAQENITAVINRVLNLTNKFSKYIWVKSDTDYYSCGVEDTLFNVTFNSTGTVQTINHPYSFEYTGHNLSDGHYAHGQAMSNWLSGILWPMDTAFISIRTRIVQTSLYAALSTKSTDDMSRNGISDAAIPPFEKALTRNLTMGQLIEELSRNLTLSYFSSDRTWLPQGINTTVNFKSNINIYAYNKYNLALAYGTAILVTILSALVGIKALLVNGVSHGTSFSSILCSTRNETLDNMTMGSSLATKPLRKEIKHTKLMFGVLNRNGNDHEPIRRVGFGVLDEVETLKKGMNCY
ncbi:hypothetical protein BDZ45DRAFT_550322, partial [Acephala macrosclerotiorum]